MIRLERVRKRFGAHEVLRGVSLAVRAGLIRRLQGDLGVTSIVVTHDFELAKFVGDQVTILDGGRIVADVPAPALDALDHPMVQAFHHRPVRIDFVV